MKKRFFLAAIILSLILESGPLNYFKAFSVKPSLSLILLTIASLCFNLRWALCFALILGVLEAIFSAGIFWLRPFLFLLFSFLIVKLSKKILLDTLILRLILIFLLSLAYNITLRVFFSCFARLVPLGIFFRITFLGALYTIAFACLILKAFDYYPLER